MPCGVIITDGNERASLAVVRSLGRGKIPVWVGAETPQSLAGASRYCTGSFVYPSPWRHPDDYIATLCAQVRRLDAGVVIPMTDLAIELLGRPDVRRELKCAIPMPSLDQYLALSDKYQLMRWAHAHGIPIPTTHFVSDGKIDALLPVLDQWPLVVKPGRSILGRWGAWRKTHVRYAGNKEELRRIYAECDELGYPSLIQHRVIGTGEGIFGLFEKGRARAIFAHRRLREKPPSGGVSVLRESISVPDAMAKYASSIAESVQWDGVAMMEFKVDRDTNIPYLMEVNGRFWGSLQLAIDAGIDFPWLLYRFATGEPVPAIEPYRVGVRSRWWLGDVDHLLLRIRKSDRELSLPPGSPSRMAVVVEFLNIFDARTKSEVLRAGDPMPAVQEFKTYLEPIRERLVAGLHRRVTAGRHAMVRFVWDIGVALGLHKRKVNVLVSRKIRTILVLCKGNVCRSPFAAAYLERKTKSKNAGPRILSAGLDTSPGEPVYPLAGLTSIKYGIDLSNHRTTMLSKAMIDQADLIVVMELAHYGMLFSQFPDAREKTCLLGYFAQKPVTDIRDPYGGTPQDFDRCYTIITAACDGLCAALNI